MTETLFGFDEKAAARILGIAPRTLRSWRKGGKVAHHVTPGGRVRYTMDQLLDLQRNARVDATIGRTLPLPAAQRS
ncbi:helix-turn-helix domain-containing protein [uncultured Sphingomonas sp.]|uniref:helix-turn-helix domain-containing protein n=1 Tax=uncultured Sphingomonas sp. TaxID=158754 RepID=UPI0037496739